MKTHSWPDAHWHWPVELTHYHGVKRGGFIFSGGQADLDLHGDVVNPANLHLQTVNVVRHLEAILIDLNASLNDLIKLVVYFVGNDNDERLMLDLIAQQLPDTARPVISSICLPALCYPGMRIELEGIAIDPRNRENNNPQFLRSDQLDYLHPHYSHLVRCNNLIFTGDVSAINSDGTVHAPGDVVAQTHEMMRKLKHALCLADAKPDDVLKLNVFYCGDGTAEDWAVPAAVRAEHFNEPGPAATGISVTHFAQPGVMTKIAVTANAQSKSSVYKPQPIRYSWPEGHWDWTTHLPYKHGNRAGDIIHLGGQVALDANATVLHPDDIVEQTKIALANIDRVLQDLGAGMNDIVKVTTFYHGGASADALHQNLTIRSSAFNAPGPATSGIPVPYLVYEQMMIEIEVIAIARNPETTT
jgi:enamine deaminase RidA (YjgF/YER057c/UK114 family)